MRLRALLVFIILMTGFFSSLPTVQSSVSGTSVSVAPIIDGDWIINNGEAITLDGQTVELRGNLIIEGGGSLTLRENSKLIINSSYSGEYGIYVKTGGSFNVLSSTVTGVEKDYRGAIDYRLKEGMNCISLPFESNNRSVDSVLSPFNGSYYKVFTYEPEDSDHWKFYSPGYDPAHSSELPSYSWVLRTGLNGPPTIDITFPGNNTENNSVSQDIVMVFDRSMDTSSIPDMEIVSGHNPGGWEFKGWRSVFRDNDTAIWGHDPFNTSDNISLRIRDYRDINGREGKPVILSFRTSSSSSEVPAYSVPGKWSENNSLDINLTVLFRSSIDTQHPPELKQIYPDNDLGWTLSEWKSGRKENDTAVWVHSIPFPSDSPVILELSNYTTALGDNGTTYYLVFFTIDTSAPHVLETYPLESDRFAPTDSEVRVIFSETMNTSHVPSAICDAGPLHFSGWESTYVRNDTVVFTHDTWEPLSSVSISIGNYTDLDGNRGSIYSWGFNTGDPRTPGIREVTPSPFSRGISTSAEVRVVFNSSMNTNDTPSIGSSDGSSWTFIGWNTTYLPHDTAIWEHSNWSGENRIRIRVSNYTDLSEIQESDIIYLYMDRDLSVNISGKVNAHPSMKMHEGWNPFPFPFLDTIDVSTVFNSIAGNYDMVRGYADNGSYVYLNSSDNMYPGKGYWVHVQEEALWSLSIYSLSGMENLFPRFGWIYYNGSSGNIQDSLVAGCGYDADGHRGLVIESDLIKVSGSEFRNGYYGLYIYDSSPIISSCKIHDSHYGITSFRAFPIISSNEIFSNSEGGILAENCSPIIAYNTISANDIAGIELHNSSSVMDSNLIGGNKLFGIYMDNSTSVVRSHIIRQNDVGIRSINSNLSVTDGSFKSNHRGIWASSSYLNVSSTDFSLETFDVYADNGTTGRLWSNTMSASGNAHIYCTSMSNLTIYGNVLISGDSGVDIDGAMARISNNIIGQNSGSGIHVQNSIDVSIEMNSISGNDWSGIYAEHSSVDIYGNNIYRNDLGVATFTASIHMDRNTIYDNKWYGISLLYSDAFLENTDFKENRWYAALLSYSHADIWNSTIENSTYSLYITHSSRVDLVNSSVDEETVHMDYSSILYVKHFLRVHLNDSIGNLVDGADFQVRDRNGIPVISGTSVFGRIEVPLTSYIRTSEDVTDMYDPYNLTVSWNGVTFSEEFYINTTIMFNLTFPAINYSVEEDCGVAAITNVTQWFPSADNCTYNLSAPRELRAYIDNCTLYIDPARNWNGNATITVHQMVDNRTVWTHRFLIHVIPVDDAPDIMGTVAPYISGDQVVFKVIYYDVENQAPMFVRVVIDGTPHEMYPEKSGDMNYTDGRSYIYSSHLPPGEHRYYYSVSDGENTVSTQPAIVDVQYHMDLITYGMYAFILIALLTTILVAYRIRRLKSGISPEDEDYTESGASPMMLRGSSIDRRRAMPRTDSGFHMPKEENIPRSTIDTGAEPEHIAMEGPTLPVDEAESSDMGAGETTPADASAPHGKKEPKYGKRTYLERTKKHRKMRVLVDDRDKYRLKPEDGEEPGPEPDTEEDVDDILRSIKGD